MLPSLSLSLTVYPPTHSLLLSVCFIDKLPLQTPAVYEKKRSLRGLRLSLTYYQYKRLQFMRRKRCLRDKAFHWQITDTNACSSGEEKVFEGLCLSLTNKRLQFVRRKRSLGGIKVACRRQKCRQQF